MRAAGGVHRRARRCVGTGIDAVHHAVTIGIGRAASLVDGRPQRSIWTGIILIRHAIAIGVGVGESRSRVWLEEGESR